MLRVLLLSAAVFVVGCNVNESDKPAPASVGAGVYQSSVEYSGDNIGQRDIYESKYDKDGSFRGRIYSQDRTYSCVTVEITGTWVMESAALIRYTYAAATSRQNCNNAMARIAGMPPTDSSIVRNVGADSYEEYAERGGVPAAWIVWKKI